jgi:2-dehydropantoate 2-reductase
MIAVKARDLTDAIRAVKRQVGPDTILLSLLNGIHSEREIAHAYGDKNVLLCTAQGMDATKAGNQLTYDHMGYLAIGERTVGSQAEQVQRVADFFRRTSLPYRIIPDMWRHMWSKFMLNTGINQVIAVYQGDYSLIQRPGEARDLMIAAMREVAALSVPEGLCLGEKDIESWLTLVDTLSPQNKPSMSQDLDAGRPTEVDLFAGTALALGEKHKIPTPVNRMFYDRIREMEAAFKP